MSKPIKYEPAQLYTEAVERWGVTSQIEMLIEEMSECMMALQKFKRDMASDKVGSVCEEIADVSIMIDQMDFVFDKKKIAEYKDFKLQRLAKSLENATPTKYNKRTDQGLSEAVNS